MRPSVLDKNLHKGGLASMANFDRKTCVMILTFWIFVPTVDIISDLTMVHKLFKGPDQDLWVSGGWMGKRIL